MEPMSHEQRAARKRKLDEQAANVAGKVRASAVYLVAFFDAGDGEHFHILDGGRSPMPVEELHKMMLSTIEKLKLTGGEDAAIQ